MKKKLSVFLVPLAASPGRVALPSSASATTGCLSGTSHNNCARGTHGRNSHV